MLTELCQYLKNWFDRGKPKFTGTFDIVDGVITMRGGDMGLMNGQYFRIIGSLLNDGVHKEGGSDLVNESFSGSVSMMALPPAIITLADDITAWRAKYENIDSEAMSPFNSESFAGYSYSKGSSDGAAGTWQAVFRARLNPWRKL